MSEVVLLCGLPASGKSTVAKRFTNYSYLNRDSEGGKITSLVPKMVELINQDKSVLLDNTFITAESRKPFIDACKNANVNIRCVRMGTSFEDSQINACLRMINKYGKVLTNDEIKQAKCPNTFPIAALFSARKKWEEPTIDEGFSEVITEQFIRTWPAKYKNKAIILDYDGTLRVTKSGEFYPRTKEDVQILPGRVEKLKQLQKDGYLLLGVSNQSGIGSGKVSEANVIECFTETNKQLNLDIDFRYCPHRAGPNGCYCRKPQIGIGIELVMQYKLNPSRCILVGDLTSDKTFATRCGFKYIDAEEFFRS